MWAIRRWRKPEELEAQNIVIDIGEPEPNFLTASTKKRILVTVVVVVIVVAVSLGVARSRNGGNGNIPTPVDQFLGGLPAYSINLAESDDASPQADALRWLKDDPQYNLYELHRLYQRYALAVLGYSTNKRGWINSAGWLTYDNECTWYGHGRVNTLECDEMSRLLTLVLYDNALGGSMPTELELLSDLRVLDLDGDALTVAVYPELYVSMR
jgi:hypothetical protein